MGAWNGWYHVNGNTYGTWLRGDPRGWRTRRHREHVEGNYKHPPQKGSFEAMYAQSKSLMKQNAVFLNKEQRRIAGQCFVEKFHEIGIELLAISMDRVHYHLLGRFPDNQVRQPVGRAKKHASQILTHYGLPGVVWAVRSRNLPLRNRQHQKNVYTYILAHANKGAWTWNYREGLYWIDTPP